MLFKHLIVGSPSIFIVAAGSPASLDQNYFQMYHRLSLSYTHAAYMFMYNQSYM